MGINPSGEDNNSANTWKKRFKQQKYQKEAFQQRLTELKSKFEDLQLKFEELSKQRKDREKELSQTKQELRSFKELAKERQDQISDLQHRTETQRIQRLEEENQQLTAKVENLQSQLVRVGGQSQPTKSVEKETSFNFDKVLIPLMLHEFDETNPKYQDAFINLVEAIISEGSAESQVIAILVKYGGVGPVHRIRGMVNTNKFDQVLNSLLRKDYIHKEKDMIQLEASQDISSDDPTSDKEDLETTALFKTLLAKVEKVDDDSLIEELRQFRDILQERSVPLTTIFFEIRKVVEKISKNTISREEVKNQIEIWFEKYRTLT